MMLVIPGLVMATGWKGEITAWKLNLRVKPDQSARVKYVLERGTIVEITAIRDGWIEILYKGATVYVRKRERYVKLLEPVQAGKKEQEKKGSLKKGSIKKESSKKETSKKKAGREKAKEEKTAARTRNTATARKKAREIDKKIEKRKKEVITFTKKESTIINGLNQIDLTLNRARASVAKIRPDLNEIDGKSRNNGRALDNLIKKIEVNEAYAAKRMVALYKLNRLGKMQVLASAESMYDFFRRKAALEKILAYDAKVIDELVKNKAELQKLTKKLKVQRADKARLEKEYSQQIKITSLERAKKKKLLRDIRNKKSLMEAAIKSLKQSAGNLDNEINRSLTNKDAKKRGKEIKSARIKDLASLKGLLNMPVRGKIVSNFGAYRNSQYKVMNFRSGIDIRADRGEPIHAVSSGRVIYSSWFKGYGNMLIIDHGEKYYTVYAHCEEQFKRKGDYVEAGEVIATVGDSGSLIGPCLYFEVRHRGKPLDPMKWIKRG